MPTAFVTGATGFLGRHLIDVLEEKGWTIIAMVRNPAAARAVLDDRVTLVKGDLTDPHSIHDAMPEGVDCVFHAAADTSTWSKEAARQQRINVEGTSTLLQTMWNKKVGRMVYVSSIAIYGLHEDPISEDTPRLGATSWVSYVRTKAFAERKVKEAVDRGIDAVIVNPTHIVGRYDSHNWARLIQMMADGSLPGVPPGAGNFANGRAVAEGIVAAYEKGRTGENYILSGPHASFHEFLSIAADLLGLPHPKKPMPEWLLKLLSRVLGFFSLFTGKRPMITPEEAYFAGEAIAVKTDKAARELGYREVPLEQTIREAIDYLKEEKLLDA
ncbi:SDR family oxidoreductase [Kordiimonas marina]|uniref:SDR family oxidoreductase n=1 Tax=Kordiimonas marina TaxID=2872312 RepID=UPI001FF292B2|nr:SDR family oxidoreductase [Kordiimonas marina]MCJ9429780.1 SDR family oxidoreductase [Kordiimonas marina]